MKFKLKDVVIVSLLGVVGFVISMVSGMITQAFGTYGVFVKEERFLFTIY